MADRGSKVSGDPVGSRAECIRDPLKTDVTRFGLPGFNSSTRVPSPSVTQVTTVTPGSPPDTASDTHGTPVSPRKGGQGGFSLGPSMVPLTSVPP